MTGQTTSPAALRIGVDFGFGFTGVALMDGARVLSYRVLKHRAGELDISSALQTRRENRAMRRRARSRRKRLRDFRALLKEMGIPAILPATTERDKNRPGNRLYAIAHWRGWDYASIAELLMSEAGDKPPKTTSKVREIDRFLKEQGVFPLSAQNLKQGTQPTPNRKRGETDRSPSLQKRRAEWQRAGQALANGQRPAADLLRWVEPKTSCLGALAKAFQAAHNAAKKAANNPADEDLASKSLAASEQADELRKRLEDGKLSDISGWIKERLEDVFAPAQTLPQDKCDELCGEIMARLGLDDGRKPHREGKIYSPHRNRHRDTAMEQMHQRLREILQELDRADEYKTWKKRTESILCKRQRPHSIDNRGPGKCSALDAATGIRCRHNVPRKNKPEVRRLLFEMAARQMNVLPEEEGIMEWRKLTKAELDRLRACVDFENGRIDEKAWRDFFKSLPTPPAKRDEDGETLATMRDQLRGIACTDSKGRTELCKIHMQERLHLLRNNKTRSDRWQALHGERILGRADAKPALLYRIDTILSELRRMLAEAGFPDPRQAPIDHIGIESARFDIAALSSAEGRKLKKAAYGKKRGRSRHSMATAQGGLCILCGETMGADSTVDHIFARAHRGGDSHKNRAAMCAACNTRKWKLNQGRLNQKAMDKLRENEPEKAAFLQAMAERKEDLAAETNLAAAQTTMFGAKVLRGALAEMLIGDLDRPDTIKKIQRLAPRQRAADLARAREQWFPVINRQKRALRADRVSGDAGLTMNVGDKPAEIKASLEDPQKRLPECVSIPAPGTIKIDPITECVKTLWLAHEHREDLELTEGREYEIGLRQKKIYGKLAAVDGTTDSRNWPLETLHRSDGILHLRARRTGKCTLLFSGRPHRIVIRPAEGHPVRKFHHAIDAIVAAANVDWAAIARLAADARQRNFNANQAFKDALREAKPLAADGHPFKDEAPPQDGADWLRPASAPKGGTKRSKTKREPLGFWRDPDNPDAPEILVQRCRLDRLARKDLGRIIPAAARVREALEACWAQIDGNPDLYEFVNDNEYLSDRWFMHQRREALKALSPEERAEFLHEHGDGRKVISAKWFHNDWPARAHLYLDPLRVRSVPLDIGSSIRQNGIASLTEKDLGKIADSAAKVREALQAAFRQPEAVKDGKLKPEWLQSLDDKHILRRTPRVPMQRASGGKRMNPRDRVFTINRRGTSFHFGREEDWHKVICWETPDGKRDFARRRPPFYINSRNAEWETKQQGGKWAEKKPPADAKVVAEFKRGDAVRIDKKGQAMPGIWQITELNKGGATLAPLDGVAYNYMRNRKEETIKKSYNFLRPARV